MKIDPKILGKIKKCLALAGSDNPNEAAVALKQAHTLMEKHGVSNFEVTMSDIGESETQARTMARDKPAQWECNLAALVGKAFGCRLMIHKSVLPKVYGPANDGKFVFVGLKHQAEVAAYTASVLIRKCKTARQNWIKTFFVENGLDRSVGRGRKSKMGDAFAEGWVAQIRPLVTDFANPKEIEDAIDRHVDESTKGAQAQAREAKSAGRYADSLAVAAGMRAAKGESLYRPMNDKEHHLQIA